MMQRLLRTIGLASIGEVRAAEEKLRGLRQRLEKASDRLAEVTAGSDRLQQTRRDEAQRHKAALAEREADYARRAAQAKEALAQASRRVAALEEEIRSRDRQFEADMRQQAALEQAVAAASHDLQVARDSLVAIEVKLDILAGAANVLDARTRTATSVSSDASR